MESVCNSKSLKWYSKMSECISENENCIEVGTDINMEICKVEDELIDNYEKPIHSKTQVDLCSGEDDCKSKLSEKYCLEGQALIDESYTETYCSKIKGYEKVKSGIKIVVEDADMKTEYDAKMLKREKKLLKIKNGQIKRRKCEDALSMIQGVFSDQDESVSDAMEVQFEKELDALRKCKYKKSKRLIAAKVVEGEVLEQLKSDLMEILE